MANTVMLFCSLELSVHLITKTSRACDFMEYVWLTRSHYTHIHQIRSEAYIIKTHSAIFHLSVENFKRHFKNKR